MYDHSNRIEKKNLQQIENISYLYNPKEDVADFIKERQKKMRDFEKADHSETKKRKVNKHDAETGSTPKKRGSLTKLKDLQLDGVR